MLKRPPDCHYPKKGTAKNIFSEPVKYGLGNMACWMLSWQWLRTLETLTHSSLYAKEVRFQWWPDYECVWFSRVLGEKLFCGEPSTWRQFNHSWIYNQRLVIGMQVQNGCKILLNYFLGTPKFTRCFTLLGKSLFFFCTTKFLYLKAHISVVYLKNVILPMKTAAALPKMWWSNCSTYGYGEIEYYYEYCHPKANKKGEKNRTGHFAWLRSGQRGRLLSRNIVNRTTFHYFHEYFCSGTNFQSIFLLFDMLVKPRCP